MKRIAIISSYAWIRIENNYGALLQYYALQQYLQKKGYYAFWIKFKLKKGVGGMLYDIKLFMKNPRIFLSSYKCHLSFLQFCHDYLNMSDKTYTRHSAKDNYPIADFYITGSDQVWGGHLPENFLTFVDDDKKKIAYAASFGKDKLTPEHINIIRPWLKKFAKISVREESGVEICNEMGVEAVHLLDPTLLLDADQYPQKQRLIEAEYVFCYFLNIKNKEDVGWNTITEYCNKSRYRLLVNAVQGSQYLFNYEGQVFPSPEEWLSYYKYAEYIITNTFHGTVFAIIHRRPFVCVLQQGVSEKQNTRMISLLKKFHLESRMTSKPDDIPMILKKEITWQEVGTILARQRKKTEDFFNFI